MAAPASPATPAAASLAAPVSRRFRWSLLNSGSGLFASAASLLLLSRTVEPGEYGRYAVIASVCGILLNTLDWSGSLLMRYGPRELAEEGSLRRSLSARLVFAAPALLLLLVAAPLYLALGRGWSNGLIALTLLYFVVYAAHNALSWSATAAQRFGAMSLGNLALRGAPVALVLLALGVGFPVRAEMILGATTLGMALAAWIFVAALGGVLGLGRPEPALVRTMWRYSLPALLGTPALAAITWLDPILLSRWAERAEVGRYQLAYATITIFAAVGASLNSVYSPELVRTVDAAARRRFGLREQPRIALLLGLGSFGGACVAAPVVRAVLPTSYAPSAELVSLLCVAGGLLLGFWTLLPLVTATDGVWQQQASALLQAVCNVGLDVALAPRFGAVGVAVANVAAWGLAYVSLALLLGRRAEARVWPAVVLVPAAGATVALILGVPSTAARLAVGLPVLLLCGAAVARELRAARRGRALSAG